MKKVLVTLSTTFRSFVRGRQLSQPDHPEICRLVGYRDSCAPAEVSFPADFLRDVAVARWLRDHRAAVDVHTSQELYSAISVGIHPVLITLHAEEFHAGDIGRVGALGVGRVVLSYAEHIAWLGGDIVGRKQNVLLRMTDAIPPGSGQRHFIFGSADTDVAVDAVLARRSLALIGLQCEVGTAAHDFVSYPAAVGTMIAQMDHIRRRHGVVLTRLVLGGGALSNAESSVTRRDLAEEIDESVDDACATLRFPRPAVVLAAGAQIFGQRAA